MRPLIAKHALQGEWAEVQWDTNGNKNTYRWNLNGAFDLKLLSPFPTCASATEQRATISASASQLGQASTAIGTYVPGTETFMNATVWRRTDNAWVGYWCGPQGLGYWAFAPNDGSLDKSKCQAMLRQPDSGWQVQNGDTWLAVTINVSCGSGSGQICF